MKPRIWFQRGKWFCASKGSFLVGWGRTPDEAFTHYRVMKRGF